MVPDAQSPLVSTSAPHLSHDNARRSFALAACTDRCGWAASCAGARMQGDLGKRPPSAETRISRVSSKDTQPQQLPSTSGATKRGQSVNDTGRDEDKDGIAPARPSLELETVNEESRSWSRKDVDLHASPKDGHTDGHALVALDGNAPLEALPAKTRELACRDEEEIPGGNTKRGPRSPNRRRSRPVRGNLMGACQRPGQDGQERSVYHGRGAQGKAAWPLVSENTVPLSLGKQGLSVGCACVVVALLHGCCGVRSRLQMRPAFDLGGRWPQAIN